MGSNEQAASRVVSIQAKPEPITIDPSTTAAIVIDMQNDFCSKGGMFDRAGIDISATRSAVEPTARTLPCVRKAGISVIYLKMGFRPDRLRRSGCSKLHQASTARGRNDHHGSGRTA